MLPRMTALLLLACLSSACHAVPSLVEPLPNGAYVVRDDNGTWGGMTMGITHQVDPGYLAKKVLDLSDVPERVWQEAKSLRLSAYFMVRDYSWHDTKTNGLDEAYEITVNGKTHRYPTNGGAPVMYENKPPGIDWYDFDLPKSEFVRGKNEVVIHKATGAKYDDYLYLGIDNTQKRGNSLVSFDGTTWRQDALNIPGGNGEYMVRLYLLTGELQASATWRPGAKSDDPTGLIAYAGAKGCSPTADGLLLPAGTPARVEWDPRLLDNMAPLAITVAAGGPVQVQWLDAAGQATLGGNTGASPLTLALGAGRGSSPSGALISADKPVRITSARVDAALSYHPRVPAIDMAPLIARPAGRPADRGVVCHFPGLDRYLHRPGQPKVTAKVDEVGIDLQNATLRARFTAGDDRRLRLLSLYNELSASEMVRDPDSIDLFLIEVDGKRYSGSRDFRFKAIGMTKDGAEVLLELPAPALQARLTVRMATDGLRMGLSLTNAGPKPVDFKLAFPHLAGLAVSDKPTDDSYFFPWGGGIVAGVPALIRRGYGDHAALYQVMDVFSPARGAGLSVRTEDTDGRYRVMGLRKHIPGQQPMNPEGPSTPTAPEYTWANSLDAVPGTSFSYEYLRRTRLPGASFTPANALISPHTGDWHTAMKSYAEWAHKVWKFRPSPSRLDPILHMIAAGWGQDILFRDGKYRTDYVTPQTDCIELMSWWDWSKLGPWGTPMDKWKTVLGEASWKEWEPYLVKDPVTGQMMWNNQPGDYDGYNERFGGLPAFRKAIEADRARGAMVTLYTDPLRMDDNTKVGQAHGKDWCVVLADGQFAKGYDVWNPCLDGAEYRQWVAQTMKRVLQETGADGIRLDEYGHQGWACFSKLHKHTFAEPGCQEWLRCVAESTRLVRQAMDEVNPKTVLTTEHPGYDFLMQFMDGCITYDCNVQATPMRPLECNTQRFYFPECKAYELDLGRDASHKRRLWNAVASFGSYYPPAMEHILRENHDVFWGGASAPLVPTAAQRIYANRFSKGDKRITMLYNATGHTFDGLALEVVLKPGEHVFDLLNGRPCDLEKRPDGSYLRLYLARDDVTCIAQLPQRLTVARKGTVLEVTAKQADGCRVVVCSATGDVLLSQGASVGIVRFDLTKLPKDAQATCVKLMRGSELVDVVGV